MSTISQWLLDIDDFIKSTSRAEKDRIWLEVKEMKLKGPPIGEYFYSILEDRPPRLIILSICITLWCKSSLSLLSAINIASVSVAIITTKFTTMN